MLASLNTLTGSLDQVVRTERVRLTSILTNLDSTISSAHSLTITGRDSLAQTMHAVQNTLSETDKTLMGLQDLTGNLNSLLVKIDSGEGTLGLLANNPSLYQNMDSTFASLNRLLTDFQKDPKRYLRHIKPVDIF
jgi:phospholipid/cholesterol/gamma-HCH transport system substrate-binding protein